MYTLQVFARGDVNSIHRKDRPELYRDVVKEVHTCLGICTDNFVKAMMASDDEELSELH